MYKVIFETKKGNKKLLKSVKGLKSKQEYSFSQAVDLFSEIYHKVNEVSVIPFKIIDQENELEYIFDDFKVTPGTEPDLMEYLTDSIISSGHEDSQKILNTIEQQYQREVTKTNSFDTEEFEANDKKKKASFLPGVFKKKVPNEEQLPILGDFAEIDDLSDEQKNTLPEEQSQEDETEVKESSVENSEPEEEQPTNDDIEDPFGPSKKDGFSMISEEDESNVIAEVFEDDFLSNDEKTVQTEKTVVQKKHERVEFPNLDSYLDLTPISSVINRITERFREEHLIGLLGIDMSSTVSELEEYKLLYARKSLSNSKFKVLIDSVNELVKSAKEGFQLKLSDKFNDVMLKDYDFIVEKSIESKYEELKTEGYKILDKLTEKLNLEEQEKKEKFEIEQRQALENFKLEQELAKTKYFNELENKKEVRLDLHTDTLNLENAKKKEELFDEELYHEKIKATNQLTEQKRLITNEFIQELGSIEEDVWFEFKEAIEVLEKEMEVLLPQWKLEIEEKRKLKAEAREELRKQEEIDLKRQEIELEKQKLIQRNSDETLKEAESIASLVERKFDEYNQQLTEKQPFRLGQVEEIVPLKNQSTDPLFNQIVSNPGKTIITGVAIAVLAIGGGALGVKVAGGSQVKESPVSYNDTTNYEGLEETIRLLEKKINEKESESTSETLESLLNEKKYDRAMSLYKDPESLTMIEYSLYNNRDLSTLVVFNKTFDTAFGELDEAILSKDSEKVLEKYKSLSEKEKDTLSQERKSDIALHLFKEGEDKLANELLK